MEKMAPEEENHSDWSKESWRKNGWGWCLVQHSRGKGKSMK